MKKCSFLFLFPLLLVLLSCARNEAITPTYSCLNVEVIGKIRSGGGGLAVKLEHPLPGAVRWQGHERVVELLNIPAELSEPGSTFYINARLATEEEKGIITADGNESITLILFGTDFGHTACEK